MTDYLSSSLAEELSVLKKRCFGETAESLPGRSVRAGEKFVRVVDQTADLVRYLASAPYSPAKTTAGHMGMSREELMLSYKLIQRTPAAAEHIKASPNGDYLNIVNHYFTNQMYVVVFFVGLACPGRCVFCPNVTVAHDGTRKISLYRGKRSDRLSHNDIESVFEDISEIKAQGTSVMVKISGGLEPLTDPETIGSILSQARDRGVRAKMFTNGLLLDTEERRRLALGTGDIRISLSVIDEKAYDEVMFGSDATRKKKYGLAYLLNNIEKLVKERDRYNPGTKIGINSIVLENNYRDMHRFISAAGDLGVDYIDFKPNYFTPYKKSTQAYLTKTIGALKASRSNGGTGVYFAGSLSRENLFWTHRDGFCHPHKQSKFKLFITPHGNCSPVHHGAFPAAAEGTETWCSPYTGGRISQQHSLLDIIANMPNLPDLAYEKLNPFEHMLALEIKREEEDRTWGIPKSFNPYHFPMADTLPDVLRENHLLRQI